MPLTKLGRYDIYSIRAKGAMGQVYEGFDPDLNRPIAIKTIRVEHLADDLAKEFESRFRTEARAAGRLHHPNIVSIYDAGRDQGVAYLVMELVQGDDLKCQLEAGTTFPIARALGILRELLSALHYAHEQGVVHRDVKPGNILLDAAGHVKLGDFGVSRIVDSGEATRMLGSMVGTLRYMSPEQVCGQKVDSRSDLFAAGVVAYQLLTGRQPFDGQNDFEIARHVVEDDPPPPSSVAGHVARRYDAVILKALAKDPAARFRTAMDFAAALRTALRDESAGSGDAIAPRTPAPEVVERRKHERTNSTGPSPRRIQPATSAIAHELELVYWKDINESEDPRDFEQFLDRFSGGVYENIARRRLRKLLSRETVVTSQVGSVATSTKDASRDEPRSELLDPTDRLEPPLQGIETVTLLAVGAGTAGALPQSLYTRDTVRTTRSGSTTGVAGSEVATVTVPPATPTTAASELRRDALPADEARDVEEDDAETGEEVVTGATGTADAASRAAALQMMEETRESVGLRGTEAPAAADTGIAESGEETARAFERDRVPEPNGSSSADVEANPFAAKAEGAPFVESGAIEQADVATSRAAGATVLPSPVVDDAIRPGRRFPRVAAVVAIVVVVSAAAFVRSGWKSSVPVPDVPSLPAPTPGPAAPSTAPTAASPEPSKPTASGDGNSASPPIVDTGGGGSARPAPASIPGASSGTAAEPADTRAQATAERLRRQKADAERKAREREDRDRIDRDRIDRDRIDLQRQKAEQERELTARSERERLDKLEQDRVERERSERGERERLERAAREKVDRERQESEARDREKADRARAERAREDAMEQEKRKRIGSPPVF